MEYEELTGKIIYCAHLVWNELGFGFLESVYEACLVKELRAAGLKVETQKRVPVRYKGEAVAEFVLDLVVGDICVVELKSVDDIAIVHEVQLVNYLKATDKPVGLLLNFAPGGVKIKRKVKELPGTVE
jgi:GxxExxY protein